MRIRRYIIPIVLGFSFFIMTACQQSKPQAQTQTEQQMIDDLCLPYYDDAIQQKNFYAAFETRTYDIEQVRLFNVPPPVSLVIFKAENANTKKIREICCESSRLKEAMHIETNVDFDVEGEKTIHTMILGIYPDKFTFKSPLALETIRFYDYPSLSLLLRQAQSMNLGAYHKKYSRNDCCEGIHFPLVQKSEQLILAHILIKLGIKTQQEGKNGEILLVGNPEKTIPWFSDEKRLFEWRKKYAIPPLT